MKKVLLFLIVALATAGVVFAGHGNTGCNPCHVAHKSGAPTEDPSLAGTGPLWNTAFDVTNSTFTMYSGTTGVIDAQPTGTSKLCLSCHDGETRTGAVTNAVDHDSQYDMATGTGDPQDLSASHPVSIVYEESVSHLKTKAAATTAGLVLEGDGTTDKVQCATCHYAHATTNDLLRVDNSSGALCRGCHIN